MSSGSCKPPYPPWALATDIDGTLVDSTYRVTAGERRLAALLASAGVPFILATSKTIDEAEIYAEKLGLPRRCPGYVIVAEEGAVVTASTPRLLPEGPLVLAGPPPGPAELLEGRCREETRTINEMSAGEVSALTGLPPLEAEAARRRRYTLALHGPRSCLRRAMEAAASMGLYARLGRVFLMVADAGGKAAALREARRRSPVLREAALAAIGDSPMDAGMLEEAEVAAVVPHPGGPAVRPRRSTYMVAEEPAPRGWEIAVRRLLPLILQGGLGEPPPV